MDIAAQQGDAQQNTAIRVHVHTCVTAEVVLPSRPREHRASSMGDLNGLESSEDCRGAGGHGNQHVRLRSAQINRTGTICPAPSSDFLLRAVAGARPPVKSTPSKAHRQKHTVELADPRYSLLRRARWRTPAQLAWRQLSEVSPR
jgi:hypothetical protein